MMIVKVPCGYMVTPANVAIGHAILTSLDDSATIPEIPSIRRQRERVAAAYTARERAWFRSPLGGSL